MSNPNEDRALDKLLNRAIIPIGLRPRTDEQIAKLLNTIGGIPVDAEKLDRMLRKINGIEPVGPAPRKSLPYCPPKPTSDEQGLIALHRAQAEAISPQIQQRIRELERRMAESDADENAIDGC